MEYHKLILRHILRTHAPYDVTLTGLENYGSGVIVKYWTQTVNIEHRIAFFQCRINENCDAEARAVWDQIA